MYAYVGFMLLRNNVFKVLELCVMNTNEFSQETNTKRY